jgi:hypothetical protein
LLSATFAAFASSQKWTVFGFQASCISEEVK